jgi:hypothetical protein
VSLKETNRLRIERLAERFNARRDRRADSADARAAFDAAFVEMRTSVLTPLLEDVGAELRRAGHDFAIELDTHRKTPSLLFRVKLDGALPRNANGILFFAQHDAPNRKSEVIAELTLRGEFELGRFPEPAEMTRTALEQMVVDGLEHLIVCNQG